MHTHAQLSGKRKILHNPAKNPGRKFRLRCAPWPSKARRHAAMIMEREGNSTPEIKILLTTMANDARGASRNTGDKERSSNVQVLCSLCDLPVERIDKASGFTGEGRDPITFPGCRHALHPDCLRAWEYGECNPEQRRLLDKRRAPRHAKLLRGLALASYDHKYSGACHRCAAGVTSV